MQIPVRTVRLKARKVATIAVPDEDAVREGLGRLRSWALTRGFKIGTKMSWLLPFETSTSIEVRCPVGEEADVHPDVGIGLRRLPSVYVALVAIPAAAGADPPTVARNLAEWAFENGYRQADRAEVFAAPEDMRNFDLALPIERRPRTHSIDV